jgi:ABC-2 type transport system ATP-binding protein
LDTPEKLRHAMGGDSVLLSGKDLPLEAIRQLPFVQKLEKIDHHIKLSIADSAKNLSELLRVAGEIDLVEVRSPDLNDVFLHFTGNEIREEGGGAMEHLRAITRARQNR